MASFDNKKGASVTVQTRKSSQDSIAPSLKSPRVARFAEATSVNSPIEPLVSSRRPFDETTEHFQPVPQPGDIGFGYINDRRSVQNVPHVEMPASPKSPLKSAMRLPGTAPRNFDNALKSPTFAPSIMMSPTWREEKLLEKKETRNDKEQAHDLRVKVRVRMAKLLLRFTNFSCSLIVLTMLGTTLTIFRSTVNLPPRNSLPAWAPNTPRWPQLVMLSVACVSLLFSVIIMIAYCRGGHKRAQKYQVYYTILTVGFFSVSIIMWAVTAGVFQHVKNTSNGTDMWGWSCKSNTREQIFGNSVPYQLICRLQNWSLVCAIIEVVVEVITIMVYGIVFYRFWSKRKLRNTMAVRDKARSELYMSQMRSGANTPGFPMSPKTPGFPGAPLSPREGGYNPMFSPRFAPGAKDTVDAAEKGQVVQEGAQFASLSSALQPAPAKFKLSKPPMKSPKITETAFDARPDTAGSKVTHVPAAPEEPQYGAVPIPGAYASPLTSPAPNGGFQRMG